MNLIKKLPNYKPIAFLDSNTLLLSKVNTLYRYEIQTGVTDYLATIPMSAATSALSAFRVLQRLLRIQVKSAFRKDNDNYLMVFKNIVYNLNVNTRTLTVENLQSWPLLFCSVIDIEGFDDMICFGEYKANLEKNEIHIFRFINNEWQSVYTFPRGEIDHVHRIIPDYHGKHVWILTGDFNQGAGIWIAKNNFNTVEPVLRNSQMYRSCVAFAVEEGLLYATDSQIEVNKIFLLQKNAEGVWKNEAIETINGSCIYGEKYHDSYVFSTTVEPYGGSDYASIMTSYLGWKRGTGILSDDSEIVFCSKHYETNVFSKNRKDAYPFFFQFGTSLFPANMEDANYFVFYNMALKRNNMCTEIWQ